MSIDKAREAIFGHDPFGRAYLNEAALDVRIREIAQDEIAGDRQAGSGRMTLEEVMIQRMPPLPPVRLSPWEDHIIDVIHQRMEDIEVHRALTTIPERVIVWQAEMRVSVPKGFKL